ncbi:hypothetical protein ACIBSS_29565 [Micromonospora aurantiaca]|uniref:hypothetical protein n=1 Tax=Micromonospora aurantiaca (nom. illeg.) TaxID=47850 RepID=UPI0037A26CE5
MATKLIPLEAFELQLVTSLDDYLARSSAVASMAALAVKVAGPEWALPDIYESETALMSPAQREQVDAAMLALAKALKEAYESTEQGERDREIIIARPTDPHVSDLIDRLIIAHTARVRMPNPGDVLHKSLLILAVSDFELLIGKVAAAIMHKVPDAVRGSDATLTLAQLIEIGSVESAVAHIVERRVEELLRSSVTEWESWFGKFSIKFRDMIDSWPEFVEIFARRNLAVHNDGIVNRQYLARIAEGGWRGDCPAIGATLDFDAKYLSSALDRMATFSILLTAGAELQICKKGSDNALHRLSDKVRELSYSGRHQAVLNVTSTVLRSSRGRMSQQLELGLRIRGWIAMGEVGRRDAMIAEVESWDVGALAPYYLHVRNVLLQRTEAALSEIREMLKTGALSPLRLRLDPLYGELRRDGLLDLVFSEAASAPGADGKDGTDPASTELDQSRAPDVDSSEIFGSEGA